MINPMNSNIGLWISSESSPENLQTVYILLANSYLLYMSIKRTWTWNEAHNWGAKLEASQKSGRAMAHPAPL